MNPLFGGIGSGLARMFSTHPATAERVRRCRQEVVVVDPLWEIRRRSEVTVALVEVGRDFAALAVWAEVLWEGRPELASPDRGQCAIEHLAVRINELGHGLW